VTDKHSYFIVRSTEDGTNINLVSGQELLDRITPDQDGETYYGSELVFLDSIPATSKGHWDDTPDNAVLIIRGEIVKPMPVDVVRKFKLP
jgi:hypothetical protein